MKKIGIIHQTSAFNTSHGKEALDLAMVMSAFEQDITVLFIGDGVFQVMRGQSPEAIQAKDYLSTIQALPFYDVEKLFVCEHSLHSRHLNTEQLIDDVTSKTQEEISELMTQFDEIYSF